MAVAKKLWDTQILTHILQGSYCNLHYLDGGASNVQIFFLAMSQFDWLGPPPENLNLCRLFRRQVSIFKHGVSSLWLSYIAERRITFAKAYGIKVRCYWEHIGNKRKNETRNSLNNLPSRVLRKAVTCQDWFLPWSQCEGRFPWPALSWNSSSGKDSNHWRCTSLSTSP